MIITYLRSSSYNTYDMCEFQYFLNYTLKLPSTANLAAEKGTSIHKVLECLAWRRKCEQENLSSWQDDAFGKMTPADCYDIPALVEQSFNYYKSISTFTWEKKDLAECKRLVKVVMEYDGGQYNPLLLDIVSPETYFDFEIDKDWAHYDYELPNGERLVGQLALKGSIDLMVRHKTKKNIYEVIDFKSGFPYKNWVSGEIKNSTTLCKDPQLLIYFYAIRKLYPDIPTILINIFYIKSPPPTFVPISDDDLPKIEDMIRKRFEEIKNNKNPNLTPNPPWKRNVTNSVIPQKCRSFCHFGKTLAEGSNISICESMYKKMNKIGFDGIMDEYFDVNKISEYSEGGGRKNVK